MRRRKILDCTKAFDIGACKNTGALVGAFMAHSSLEWHHSKVAEVGKIEIEKETVCQNDHTGLGLMACAIENEN